MNEIYYEMIFKRKSFHRFSGLYSLTTDDLQGIQHQIKCLVPLIDDIQTQFQIVPREHTSCTRGEYCILIYSEVKEHYLLNIGYMAQQLDLWFASQNIGACWYGMGKTQESHYQGLDFVIMIAIERATEKDFRKDYTKAKRKDSSEIWDGSTYPDIASVVRYAPSTCNTQPWFVQCENNILNLYRIKGKRGMMPLNKVTYYNTIDMGIFMLFLELCLEHEQYEFNRELRPTNSEDKERIQIATYSITK